MDGQKKVGSFNLLTKRLVDDETKEKINNVRREQLSNNKQPAQDRLKRLQTKLKLNNKKPDKERFATKYNTRNSINSVNNKATIAYQQSHLKKGSLSVEIPATPSHGFSDKIKSWSKNTTTNDAIESSPSGFNKRRSIDNAWAKPKALLDASNRLESNRSISANQRLALLRESLQSSVKESHKIMINNNNNNELPSISKKLPILTASKVIQSEESVQVLSNNSTDDVEPMDIDYEQQEEEAKTNNTSPTLNESTEVKLDLFGASEDQKLPKRLEDHMYFVLDTNVLIDNLAFVEDLSRVALGKTKGSMLYIPYIVIKELDRLKDRRNEESLKRSPAIRAIHYLNNKFDDSLKIQAQSALENTDHLIDVDCGDDSIVNCCLQLMTQVPNLMLLTNDANLRLKANASSILVSCRSDLLNDYREKFDALSS